MYEEPDCSDIDSTLAQCLVARGNSSQPNTNRDTLMVTVPFEFTAGDKTFPAGDYSIVSTAPDRLSVRDSRGHVLASLVAHSAGWPNDYSRPPRLTFYSVGGAHALTQVWMESSIGYELAPPQPVPVVAKRRSSAPPPSPPSVHPAGNN